MNQTVGLTLIVLRTAGGIIGEKINLSINFNVIFVVKTLISLNII